MRSQVWCKRKREEGQEEKNNKEQRKRIEEEEEEEEEEKRQERQDITCRVVAYVWCFLKTLCNEQQKQNRLLGLGVFEFSTYRMTSRS